MAPDGAQTGRSRPAKAGAVALVALAAGLAAFWVVKAIIIFIAPESEWVAPLPATPAFANPSATVPLDVNFDAFHRGSDVAVIDEVVGEDAPETTLNLVLKGQRAGPNGSATIQTPDRRQSVYYLEDEVLPGVTLESVQSDFVVIRRATGLERLSNRRDELFGQAIAPGPTSAREANTMPRSLDTRNMPRPSVLSGAANNPLARIVPGDLLQTVSLTPVREGAGLLGYRMEARNGDFKGFGFKNGDVVTRVNSIDLTDDKIVPRAIFQELQQSSSAVFTVLRDGVPITIRVGQ